MPGPWKAFNKYLLNETLVSKSIDGEKYICKQNIARKEGSLKVLLKTIFKPSFTWPFYLSFLRLKFKSEFTQVTAISLLPNVVYSGRRRGTLKDDSKDQ